MRVNGKLIPRREACRTLATAAVLLPLAGTVAAAAEANAPVLEGYAGRVSYVPGEELTLHLSTSTPTCSVELLRLGAKPESVWRRDGIATERRAVPPTASSHGCDWPVSVSLKLPAEWRTGYYQVRLRTPDHPTASGTCFFILRPAPGAPRAKILLQLSTNTYNAYNNYGGFSLYAYNGRDGNQGHRVSFQRPPASQFANWEEPFVIWAEQNGIALDYAANNDLEFHPEILTDRRLVLSVGHDEYWSAPMRDTLEKFIAQGGNVAFFSGNTCCWQVRSEDQGQALACWKQNYHSDPIYQARQSRATLSSLWSHYLVRRPENELTGVGFLWGGYHLSHGQLMDGSGAFTVHRPEHWLFAGTDLKRGDAFGGKDTIVGYECDGCQLTWRDGLPFPTHKDGTPESFEILGTAPAQWHPDDCQWYDEWENGRKGNAVLGVYTRGGTVFTCGSTDWAHGLRGGDPFVRRITRNILERLGA